MTSTGDTAQAIFSVEAAAWKRRITDATRMLGCYASGGGSCGGSSLTINRDCADGPMLVPIRMYHLGIHRRPRGYRLFAFLMWGAGISFQP
jgi:hypothetical protein